MKRKRQTAGLKNLSPALAYKLGKISQAELKSLTAAGTSNLIPWSGVIGYENRLTGDGRLIQTNALELGHVPVPFRFVGSDVGAHDGATYVGIVETAERREGGEIFGTGFIDPETPDGAEMERRARKNGNLPFGVSMDLDDISFEIRVAKEIVEEQEAMSDMLFAKSEDESEDESEEESDTDDEGRVTVFEMNSSDEVMVMTTAGLRGLTGVDIPAFVGAEITLELDSDGIEESTDEDNPEDEETEEVEEDEEQTEEADALVAAAAPLAPPADWFRDPGLTEPTPLTVSEDGRIYGHIAAWNTCHTAFDICTTPPVSHSDYAYFRTGSVMLDNGQEVAVGRITLDTLHAHRTASATATLAHYENTGKAVGEVVAGEDAHGIWISGALRSTVDEETKRVLRASPLSGDWRKIGGNLELVAVLAVNSPGFPIPRPNGLVASGSLVSLVASGMVAPAQVIAPGAPGALSTADLRYLKRLADRERKADAGRIAEAEALANRVKAIELTNRVRAITT